MRRISFTCDDVSLLAGKYVNKVLASGQFSPGPMVRELEARLANLHKAKHAIFVNSGTDALRLSLLAMKEKYGWQDGDEVAVPALTFVATVNIVIQAGLTPFFIDVGMNDWTMNPWNLDRMAEGHDKLKAVIPVQLFGQDCDPYLYSLCERNGWKVLEDSCETILNPLRGEVGCHSTYMAHHLTTGVGGFALTNDDRLNWIIRSLANHGRDQAYLPGYSQIELSRELLQRRFKFNRQGYSCRPTEFEAALGLAQIEDLKANVQRRRYVYEDLQDSLCEFDELHIRDALSAENNSAMMFPMLLKAGDKYDLCLHLEKNGIGTRDMMPITNQPCFKKYFPQGYSGFSVANEVNENGFYIPCHQGMTEDDVAWIGQVFERYFTKQTGRLDKVANVA